MGRNASRGFKVRPFHEYFDRGTDAMTAIAGSIQGHRFVVTVLGREIELKTTGLTADARGPVALVEGEGTWELPDGFSFEVWIEEDEDLGPSLALTLVRRGDAARLALAAVAAAGIEPPSINVIAPPDVRLTVYFGPDGSPAGRGVVGRGTRVSGPSN